MLHNLKNSLKEALATIMPIAIFVMLLTLVIPIPVDLLISFLISSFLLIIGTGLFTFGADISMLIIGERIGSKLVRSKKLWIILVVSLIIGTVITIAEPKSSC